MTSPEPSIRFRRQLDLLPLDRLDVPVTVIGAGAVGSFTVLTLAKMGLSHLTAWDDDVIDEHNLPNQFFRLEDLGRPKVEALAELVRSFEGVELTAVPRRFTGTPLRGIVISAVDSMRSRAAIWESIRDSSTVDLFLDARMGAQVSVLYGVRPSEIGRVRSYEATLHGDDEAMQEPCSARAILYTVLALSASIARAVRLHLVGEQLPFQLVQDHVLGLNLAS